MPATPEYNIESIVIALLATHATFASVSIVHKADEDRTPDKNRLIVTANPKVPAIIPYREEAPIAIFKTQVTIEARRGSRDATGVDGWVRVIDTIMNSAAPAPILTLAATMFTKRLKIHYADGGARDQGQTEKYQTMRTFQVIFEE